MVGRTITQTADERRVALVESALRVFARAGYVATPITEVAADARISPAYAFKLFPTKEQLFVAAVDHCYAQIVQTLREGAGRAGGESAAEVLDAMGGAYAELIARRELLMIQVHAQAALHVPAIAEAVRRGLGEVTRFAQERSGGTVEQVQGFIAFGQLCHLLTATGLFDDDAPWARALTSGVRHHPPA